jgi:uncharacterized flavoprotein (TIGR03862 family)
VLQLAFYPEVFGLFNFYARQLTGQQCAGPPLVAIVGTGPAGLVAASVISKAGFKVILFEKRRGPGRKLLVAGSSGLNISNALPPDDLRRAYKSSTPEAAAKHFKILFEAFPPQAWLNFIHDLGLETFEGSSRRYFVKDMKAEPLVRAWIASLENAGVEIRFEHECTDFEVSQNKVTLHFSNGTTEHCDAALLALGGASYEKTETPLRWPAMFENKQLRFNPFRASNTGFETDWPAKLLEEAEGLPLKNIKLTTKAGSRLGDLIITKYGLEGTPVYQLGEIGQAYLDLKPDLTATQLRKLALDVRENLSPIRRVKKCLRLSPGALALVFHCTPPETRSNLEALLERIKNFPIDLKARRPLQEAISSAGGLSFDELNDFLMLKKYPGVFVAGEMLDWDAPTGGFLIQACASQGFLAGQGICQYIKEN